MNRIAKMFNKLKHEKRKGLISYVTAGDPEMQMTLSLLHSLVAGGVDALEVGVAFSDPVADGTVIQAAHQRALKAGSSLKATLAMISKFRQTNIETPIILMSYINPIENFGYDNFIASASQAGIDGVIIVDMPPEEGEALLTVMQAKGIYPIFLIAPTTKETRLKEIANKAQGFVYLVSLKGVTGTKSVEAMNIAPQIKEIQEHTSLPIAVGFGIRDSISAGQVAEHADAVIVGSAFVSLIEQNLHDGQILLEKVNAFAKELRQALDAIAVAA